MTVRKPAVENDKDWFPLSAIPDLKLRKPQPPFTAEAGQMRFVNFDVPGSKKLFTDISGYVKDRPETNAYDEISFVLTLNEESAAVVSHLESLGERPGNLQEIELQVGEYADTVCSRLNDYALRSCIRDNNGLRLKIKLPEIKVAADSVVKCRVSPGYYFNERNHTYGLFFALCDVTDLPTFRAVSPPTYARSISDSITMDAGSPSPPRRTRQAKAGRR